MLEYLAIWIYDIYQSVGVDAFSSREYNRFYLTFRLFQVLKELTHVVTLIDEDGLSDLLQHELVFWILERRLGNVTCVLVANESVDQDVVKLEEKRQSTVFVFLLEDWLHWWQEDFCVDDTQILKQASALFFHLLALSVLLLVV